MEEVNNPEVSQPVESEIKVVSAVTPPPTSGNWWKISFLMVGLVLAGSIAYAGWQFSQKQTVVSQPTPTPLPAEASAKEGDPTADWTTYHDNGFLFKHPIDWIVNPVLGVGGGIIISVKDPLGIYTFSLRTERNYNQDTQMPYKSIYEYLKISYQLKTKIVDGIEAIQALPRAGSESDFAVFLFSKSNQSILTVELVTPRDGSKIIEGEILFDQILSTFRFN